MAQNSDWSVLNRLESDMLTEQEILHLQETNPELMGKKLMSYQQRIRLLLARLNQMNAQMLQVRLKELKETES